MPNGIIYKYFTKLYFSVKKIKINLCYVSEFRMNDVIFIYYTAEIRDLHELLATVVIA